MWRRGESTDLISCPEKIARPPAEPKEEMHIKDRSNFLETLFDAVPSPVFFKDIEGVYRHCNEAFAQYAGVPKSEIIGKTDYDLNSEKIAAAHHEFDLTLIQNRQVQYYEVSFKNPDGTRQDIIFHKACFIDKDGSVVGLVGVLTDVTEHRKVEEEKDRLTQELRNALAEIKTLKGLLPICSYCRKIRTDEGYWLKLESYVEEHSDARFSHGICSDCLKKHYPKYYEKQKHGEKPKE